jgi:hypothetical protein
VTEDLLDDADADALLPAAGSRRGGTVMTARPAESPDTRNESLPAGDHRELARQTASGFEVFGQPLAATGPARACRHAGD